MASELTELRNGETLMNDGDVWHGDMGSIARCQQCGSAIVTSIIGEDGERMAACSCTKILGATVHDTPDHWAPVLPEEQDRDPVVQ